MSAIIRLLETVEDIQAVEDLQRQVWPGSDIEIVPTHMLITAIHNGGLMLGAFVEDRMVGFVFGFPGLEKTPDGPRAKHCSHMMGIHPDYRDAGIGFALKRAQWQMVRHQGLDHITWTYDPLMSRNAYLNIARLGAVCNTYHRSEYGDMRDGLNLGLPSDRFQVDWWVHTRRVQRRLGKRARKPLNLKHFYEAEIQPLYQLGHAPGGWPKPPEHFSALEGRLALADIPPEFLELKAADFALARDWRFFTRELFETAFAAGYIVTDYIFERTAGGPRCLYVMTHGESTLDEGL